jgi:hypothetical protein
MIRFEVRFVEYTGSEDNSVSIVYVTARNGSEAKILAQALRIKAGVNYKDVLTITNIPF